VSDYGKLKSDISVVTGHEYGVISIGYVCIDDEEGGCTWYPYASSQHASVNVAVPTPQITSLSTYSVSQGDHGTLTITGTNLVKNSGDQLTINFSGSGNPFSLTGTPSSSTASFSYNFSGYPAGTYNLSVTNNEGTSNSKTFTVIYEAPQDPIADPCAVTSNPQTRYSAIVSTGTAGGSGSMAVSFSVTAFAAVSASVTYGPYSTPSSIAANIASLITRNYYRYGLGAKAFGPLIVYSGNTTLGTVNNLVTGPSFTTTTSSTTAAEAESACGSAPPPPLSMYAGAYSAYIPVDHVVGPDQCTYSYPTLGSSLSVQLLYRGDAYHNTYRVTQAVSLNFTTAQASGNFNDVGTTESYGFGSPYNGQAADLSSNDDDAVLNDCYLRNNIGRANTGGWILSTTVLNSGAIIGMTGSGQNPLSYPFGAIGWSMTTNIDAGSNTGHVAYQHTCYPAHQVKVANTTLYRYIPPNSNTI
jgi:hypothetical protein